MVCAAHPPWCGGDVPSINIPAQAAGFGPEPLSRAHGQGQPWEARPAVRAVQMLAQEGDAAGLVAASASAPFQTPGPVRATHHETNALSAPAPD